MIVNRRTINVKSGRMDEAVALIKLAIDTAIELEKAEYPDLNYTYRLYAPSVTTVAPYDVLVMELEYKDLADFERRWRNWDSGPGAQAFWDQWTTLTERGGTCEIWELVGGN